MDSLPTSYTPGSGAIQKSADSGQEEPKETIAQPAKEEPLIVEPKMTPASMLGQMESHLKHQLDTCQHYMKLFQEQNNESMASKFEAYVASTEKDTLLLRNMFTETGKIPKYKIETVKFNCLPVNVDVKDKELQVIVKTFNLPVASDSIVYAIGEFEFPFTKLETLGESIARWFHSVKIQPSNLCCCTAGGKPKQLDIIYATKTKPFQNPESDVTLFNRPLSFFVDKGKSRTLKRKFKPVVVTFYEKSGFFSKTIGNIKLKIDLINDDASILSRQNIMDGRKQTEGIAEVQIKVRESLIEKSLRPHEEKLLLLA